MRAPRHPAPRQEKPVTPESEALDVIRHLQRDGLLRIIKITPDPRSHRRPDQAVA